MNAVAGSATPNGLQSAKVGPQYPLQRTITKVDNGYIVVDTTNYSNPMQKVALTFDSMVDILRESFNEVTSQ